MISEGRPLKTVFHDRLGYRDKGYVYPDAFTSHTCDTIDIEQIYLGDDDEPLSHRIVEACHADWFEKDGYIDDLGYERSVRVKCMEVASYHVAIGSAACPAGSAGSYCEFHRPRVTAL